MVPRFDHTMPGGVSRLYDSAPTSMIFTDTVYHRLFPATRNVAVSRMMMSAVFARLLIRLLINGARKHEDSRKHFKDRIRVWFAAGSRHCHGRRQDVAGCHERPSGSADFNNLCPQPLPAGHPDQCLGQGWQGDVEIGK